MTPPYCRIIAAATLALLYGGELAAQHAGHHEAAVNPVIPMSREASGTSWQPDAAPHTGNHAAWGDWAVMWHGMAQLAYTDQHGPRGDQDLYLNNMLMARGTRPWGDGEFGLRGMVSLEPVTVGDNGYPLLLQTGETADGVNPLLDAQHPHDLFMELAATYEWDWSPRDAGFVYFGLPGEPALGPPAFMHRFSAAEFPDAPIGHHWLDATHITFGVLTGGWIHDDFKFELSSFTGREPDHRRYNIESPKFDSWSARVSWNPGANWALQASGGRLHSPEQLHPDSDVTRYTASAMYSVDTAAGHWQTTGAWGRNLHDGGGHASDTLLLETAWRYRPRHTLIARGERSDKDELVPGAHAVHQVARVSLGYVYDLWQAGSRALGLGVTGTVNFVPVALEPLYGSRPTAVTVFARLRF